MSDVAYIRQDMVSIESTIGSDKERPNQIMMIPRLVVATPDLRIQEMMQMALDVRGYQHNCTLIDRRSPFDWIARAVREQPEIVIVDVDIDLPRRQSVQENILNIRHAWSSTQRPGWIFLSRRSTESPVSPVLWMPFRWTQLESHIRRAFQSKSIF